MRTRVVNSKEQIFCEWRHHWVRLTPEEWVRQQLLHRLVEQRGYPASLIAVEVPLEKLSIINYQLSTVNYQLSTINCQLSTNQRCDAVVYDNAMRPLMIIECKAETVPLTQRTLDQAVTYNRLLNVPWLLLHNGPQTLCVRTDTPTPTFSASIPSFDTLTF